MTESITEEILRGLRAASWAGDGPGLVALLPGLPLTEVLQWVGDALLGAAADRVPGAAEAAEQCVALLEERGWEGDEELASQFEGALGQGPVPLLRPLTADLEELSGLLEGDPLSGGGRIDLTTGECWPEQVDIDEEDEGLGRWLPVPCEGSRDGYRDMELFITTVADAGFADRLEIAISGRGAFRRFKDVLARSEDEYSRYHRFSGERQRGRARAWLAGQGYRPVGRR
ncbi:UPF0158 family protein [Streptomyces sp. NPDC057910]|uniref:UPF0158 family protein n=1 Tax=Streptomyces sp. NPDC057910 TaxID=3346278 RepID=UPI0036EC2E71